MDHQCHSEFQFCIEAISMGGREGERAERKEGGKEGREGRGREGKGEERREDLVFLLNKKLFLLNFSSLKPVLLFKGEEAQNCLAECIYECSKVFREKRQKVKETEKFKLCLDSP